MRAPASGSGSTIARRRRASPFAAIRRRSSSAIASTSASPTDISPACRPSGGDVMWARSLAGDATRFMDVDSTPLYYRDTLYVVGLCDRRVRARSEGRVYSVALRCRGRDDGARARVAALFHGDEVGLARARSRRAPSVAAVAGRGRRAVGADGAGVVPARVVGARRHLRRRRAQRAAIPVLRARPRRHVGGRPPTGGRCTCCRTPATSTRSR